MRNIFFCICICQIFFLSVSDVFGQGACFKFLTDSVGCVPFRVQVVSCSQAPATSTAYNFDFQQDSTFANFVNFPIDTFTYKKAGTYRVVQDIGQGRRFVRFVVVRDTVAAAAIQTIVCSNRQVFFKITDLVYDYFVINYGDGNSRLVRSGDTSWVYQYGVANSTVSLRLEGRYFGPGCGRSLIRTLILQPANVRAAISRLEWYTPDSLFVDWQVQGAASSAFRLLTGRPLQPLGAAFAGNNYTYLANPNTSLVGLEQSDFCSNKTTSIPAAAIRITDLQSQNTPRKTYLQLDWSYDARDMQGVFEGFYIYRNNSLVYIGAINMRSFADSVGISCKNTYFYRVEVHWKLSGDFDFVQKSISQTQSIQLQTGVLPEMKTFWAGFQQNNQLVLHLQVPPGSSASQITVRNNATGKSTTLLPTDTMLIADKSPSGAACYTAFWQDSCNNNSPEQTLCPIWLSQPDPKNPFLLNWTTYMPAPLAGAYKLVVSGSGSSQIQTLDLGSQNSYQQSQPDEQNQLIRYQICVILSNNKQSCSNILEIRRPMVALLPDAFTPNNDSHNDTYMGIFKFVAHSDMKIIDRWGRIVFRQTNPQTGWDGTDNGQLATPGVYVAVLEVQDQTGRKYNYTKNISLIR